MEKVAGEQDLALQQHFPYKSSKFSENSNWRINFLFNASNLAIMVFSVCYFRFWHIKYFEENLGHLTPAAKGLLSKRTIFSKILLIETLKLTATTAFYYFTIVLNPLAPQLAVLIEVGQDNQWKKKKHTH